MVELRNIVKTYKTNHGVKLVLDDVSCVFEPGVNTGIIGRNGAGKSTLIRLIGGVEVPDSGKIIRTSRLSWPLGFSGGLHRSLTGRENLRFTCRIYGADVQEVTRFVEEFSELGDYMDMPLRSYSSGMRGKLAFGLSMAIGFDYYLIDETIGVGDASFTAKCRAVFEERKANATLIVVSHHAHMIKQHCSRYAVLDKGRLEFFTDFNEAFAMYNRVCLTK